MNKWETALSGLSEALPVDVYPASNGEFLPGRPTAEQHRIMALAEHETEKARHRIGMSRRSFVRTSAAMAIGIWSIGQVTNGRWGRYALADHDKTNAACDLEWPGAQLDNMPGEFIFDVQSHHIDPAGMWRVTNPRSAALYFALWSQAGPFGGLPGYHEDQGVQGFGRGREIDPMENLSRYHYLKELYLDSSTNMTVLSAIPSPDEGQALTMDQAAETVHTVNELAQNTPRCVMHRFVMPNRGWGGSGGVGSVGGGTTPNHWPAFFDDEMERMEQYLVEYPGTIRGWKVYCPYGDVPNASGWVHDSDFGMAFAEHVRALGDKYGVPKTIATHKGFALPGFDQRAAASRDIGPAAKAYPDVNFVVYHSGYDSDSASDMEAYPGDDQVDSSQRSVNSLVKSLRENEWDASRFVPPGLEHGNVPNVWGEIGSVWSSVMNNADRAAHLFGKLITHVGPQRIAWGTDCLWQGSPQRFIVALRAFRFSEEAKEYYNLPHGLEGDRFDPRRNALDGGSYMSPHPAVANWPTDGRAHPERTIRNGIFGRNIAPTYFVDPDAARELINCDDVQKIRDGYILNRATPDPTQSAPFASNRTPAFRTDEEVLDDLYNTPWSP